MNKKAVILFLAATGALAIGVALVHLLPHSSVNPLASLNELQSEFGFTIPQTIYKLYSSNERKTSAIERASHDWILVRLETSPAEMQRFLSSIPNAGMVHTTESTVKIRSFAERFPWWTPHEFNPVRTLSAQSKNGDLDVFVADAGTNAIIFMYSTLRVR
jgi:hypothetical protein